MIISFAPQGRFDVNGHWLTCNQLPVLRLQAEPGFVQCQPLDKFQAIRIKGIKRKRTGSLMLSADQLGFTAQQLADLAAYLESY